MIPQGEGGEQGDPLMPLLSLHKALVVERNITGGCTPIEFFSRSRPIAAFPSTMERHKFGTVEESIQLVASH